jgi:hypothetical protein
MSKKLFFTNIRLLKFQWESLTVPMISTNNPSIDHFYTIALEDCCEITTLLNMRAINLKCLLIQTKAQVTPDCIILTTCFWQSHSPGVCVSNRELCDV